MLGFALLECACAALLDTPDVVLVDADGGRPDGPVSRADDASSACTADTSTDPHNCGRCGRDCLGASCARGTCAPTLLADQLAFPDTLAVGSSDVYVTSAASASVLRIPKQGGKAVTMAYGQFLANGIAAEGSRVFWSNDGPDRFDGGGDYGGIWTCTAPACTDKRQLAVDDFAHALVLRPHVLYYAAFGAIMKVPVAGGSPQRVARSGASALAVDDTHVYALDTQGLPQRAQLADGTLESFGPSEVRSPGAVALDQDRVYWAYADVGNRGHVLSAAKGALGGATIAYGSEADNVLPYGIAVDAEYVYWTTSGTSTNEVPNNDGSLFACRKTGCNGAPLRLVDGITSGAIAVDDVFVYWLERGGQRGPVSGRLRRMVRL